MYDVRRRYFDKKPVKLSFQSTPIKPRSANYSHPRVKVTKRIKTYKYYNIHQCIKDPEIMVLKPPTMINLTLIYFILTERKHFYKSSNF